MSGNIVLEFNLTEKNNESIKRLTENYKNLTEGEFNYELVAGPNSNSDFDNLIKVMENQVELAHINIDSTKRFEIAKNFFEKLLEKKMHELNEYRIAENEFIETKKIVQSQDQIMQDFKLSENLDNREEIIEKLCKTYAYFYERVCKLFFKTLAMKITKKSINSCGMCINEIIKFDSDMEFVLKPFIPQIRNSINHADYYYNSQKNVMVFEDREKIPLEVTVEELRNLCQYEIISEVCIVAAEYSLKLPQWKVSEYYWNKTEEYCRILQVDFQKLVPIWLSNGKNILELHNILEKMIESGNTSFSIWWSKHMK